MASIQKTAKGYRVQIKLRVKGDVIRDSQVFATKREAVLWATQRETEIRDERPAGERKSLFDALTRYGNEVLPDKRGQVKDQIRLESFKKLINPKVLHGPIGAVTVEDIAALRDERLSKVKASSVLRELTLLSSVFESARREWKWVTVNPVRDVRKPSKPRHRERLIQWHEVRRFLRETGYGGEITRSIDAVSMCFLVALRTGMRAGELCSLRWVDVHERHVYLPTTKNGRPREVPLSSRAKRLIEKMRGYDEELVFGLKTSALDALFRKYRERAGIAGITFHDSRHTAATMLAKTVDGLTLCRIFGWSDTRQALTYFNMPASSIAAMLG